MSEISINGFNDEGKKASVRLPLKKDSNNVDAIPTSTELTNQNAQGGRDWGANLVGTALAKEVVSVSTTRPIDMSGYGRAFINVNPLGASTSELTVQWSPDGDINNAGAAIVLLAAGTGGNRSVEVPIQGIHAHYTLTTSISDSYWMPLTGREIV